MIASPGFAYPTPYNPYVPTMPLAQPFYTVTTPPTYGTPWDASAYYYGYSQPMPQYAPPPLPTYSYTQPMPSFGPPPVSEAPSVSEVTPGSPSFSEVKASHILVKTRQEAEKIRKEILSGKKKFEEAAKVSKCPSGKKGGDLGFFAKGDMVPEFDKVAFKLPIGVISEPVKTEFGWHLIRVTEQR